MKNSNKLFYSLFSSYVSNCKGQLISKANCKAINSFKKETNEFIFTTMRCVFVRFWEEIEETKKTFRNYLTFTRVEFITGFTKAHFLQKKNSN